MTQPTLQIFRYPFPGNHAVARGAFRRENKHPLIAKVIIQRLAKILLIPCPVHVNILMKMFVGVPPLGIVFQMATDALLSGI